MDWREITREMRHDFAFDVAQKMKTRYDEGAKEHGDTFQGDPLDHLEEELIDALFYCWVAKRRQIGGGHD